MEDLFNETVRIPQMLVHGNFSLEVLLIREEETRRYNRRRNWRRNGWGTEERRLLEVVDRQVFAGAGSWLAFLPRGFDRFTSRDLADAIGVRVELAQKMTYSLREAGLVTAVGKRGRALLYEICASQP